MRENYRYLIARISPPIHCEAKEIYLAASESFTALYGEIDGSRAWLAVMEYSVPYAIFRYRRGEDTKVEASLTCVNSIAGSQGTIHPLKRSGTIRTLREEFRKKKPEQARSGIVKIRDATFHAEIYPSGKIDLKEKGINPHITQYITEEDIEDLYYDE